MINITNPRARRLYVAEFSRQMAVLEATFFREIRPLLGRQYYNAANLVQNGVLIDGINHAVDLGRRRWIDLFQKHYKRTATVFGKKAYGIIEESQKSFSPSEIKGPKDEFWNSIGNWTSTQTAQKVRKIQDTTKTNIANVIHKGMQEGESNREIAKRIKKTSAAINPHRANVISRNETHTAAVKSVDVAVASTRIEMEREWVSARDMRTRTRTAGSQFEHFLSFPAGPDGERVAQDGKFKGTGQALSFPGDPKGSAANTILCRCVIIYHSVKRIEELKPHEPEELPGYGFESANNIDELNKKTNNLGLGRFDFDKKYKEKERLVLGNKINEHFHDIQEQFPGLKKKIADQQKLFDFEIIKGRSIASQDFKLDTVFGSYKKGPLRIRIAGSRTTRGSLKIGKKNFTVGDDLFSVSRHEYGHHFFDHLSKERKPFAEIWRNNIPKGGGTNTYFSKKVSEYAGTNMNEAFSECFSAYTSPLYKPGMLPKAIEEYFDDLLGKRKLPGLAKPVVPSSKTKPMTVIGDLVNCVVSSSKQVWNIFEIKKPKPCKDFVRIEKEWYLHGVKVTDKETLKRLDAMKLPPAWRQVTVSVNPASKVQAVGMDRVGRWQYQYSADHIEKAARKKFDRVKLFSKEMPNIQKGIREGISKNDSRAFLLDLESKTAIRAGSTTDFRARKKAYGLTTLQNEHIQIKGNKIILDFTAKEGIAAHYELEDRILASWLQERKNATVAGEMLFPDIPANKLNDYIKKLADGKKYTIKDFRTYHGTRIAFEELRQYAGIELSIAEKKAIVKKVSEKASDFLKNTPGMARNSYIDPVVWDFIGGLP